MPNSRVVLAAGLAGLLASAVLADEKFDPAARAKVVAPYLQAQTIAVVRADLSRVAVEPLFAMLAQAVPQATADLQTHKDAFIGSIGGLTKLGVTDFYLVFSTASLPPPPPLGLLVLKPGVDAAAVRAAVPDFSAATRQVGDVLVLADRDETLAQVASLKPDVRPELAQALEAAGDAAVQIAILPPKHFARVLEETMPELPKEIGGGPMTIVTHGALWAAIGINLPPDASVKFVVQSQDAPAAAALVGKIDDTVRFVGGLPATKKLIPRFDQIAPKLRPAAEESRVYLTLDDPATLLDLTSPPLEQARLAAKRSISTNNLKQIALAMHNYYDVNKSFPPAAKCDANGKPLVSWRVLILPYIEQGELFKQFHLDEAWDSPHNRALISRMPEGYRSPLSKLADKTRTNYVLPVGPEVAFNGPRCVEFKEIRDGTSNTIMTLEVDDSEAVVWTKPDDLPFDPKNPLKGLGGLSEGGFLASFMDGSVRFITTTIPPATMKALITPDGGEVIDFSNF